MEVKRFVKQDVSDFNIGDVIDFTLTDGEEVQAMAMKKLNNGMLFCLVDCLSKEYSMNNTDTNAGGYLSSKLRTILNSEVVSKFPAEIKESLVKFSNGDYLRIPTEKEIFGENKRGEIEADDVEQWEPMKLCKNRIAFQGKNGGYEWYWTQNKTVSSSDDFCAVGGDGSANYDWASNVGGARPTFILNLESHPCMGRGGLLYE